MAEVGVVVIGRNEGERLRVCLTSTIDKASQVVYVDSGSSDNSTDIARSLGVDPVELDMSIPFTAARARNTGYWRLVELASRLDYVQFVDGDCEVHRDWIETAYRYLEAHGDVAAVSGRRRERYPEATIYNLLCGFDWDAPAGESLFCGGDAMIRISAFAEVGGFRDDLIAGEEPELCLRMRKAGWRIWRLEAEMTLHDADMTRFSQWWKRDVRCGFTYAQGVHELGRECRREYARVLFWGGLMPALLMAAVVLWGPAGLLLVLVYPLQVVRITLGSGRFARDEFINALFLTIGKFAEMAGVLKYFFNRVFRITNRLIEYK
jgi:glycosyltransferase involved in cell wall biosynthesis